MDFIFLQTVFSSPLLFFLSVIIFILSPFFMPNIVEKIIDWIEYSWFYEILYEGSNVLEGIVFRSIHFLAIAFILFTMVPNYFSTGEVEALDFIIFTFISLLFSLLPFIFISIKAAIISLLSIIRSLAEPRNKKRAKTKQAESTFDTFFMKHIFAPIVVGLVLWFITGQLAVTIGGSAVVSLFAIVFNFDG